MGGFSEDIGMLVSEFRFDSETEDVLRDVVLQRTGSALTAEKLRSIERSVEAWRHVYQERARLKPRAKQIKRELQRALAAKDVDSHYQRLCEASPATQHEVMTYAGHRWQGRKDFMEAAADALKYLELPNGRRQNGARRSLVSVLVQVWVSLGGRADDPVWDNRANEYMKTPNASPLALFLAEIVSAVEGTNVSPKALRSALSGVCEVSSDPSH